MNCVIIHNHSLCVVSVQSLVREPLKTRRELLRSSFNEIEGVGHMHIL